MCESRKKATSFRKERISGHLSSTQPRRRNARRARLGRELQSSDSETQVDVSMSGRE